MKRIGILLIACALAWPAVAATKTVTLDVKGWSCGSCAATTRAALKKLDGVENVKTDHETGEAIVTYDDEKVTSRTLIDAVESVGYSAAVKAVVDGAPAPSPSRPETVTPEENASGESKEGIPEARRLPEEVSFFRVPLECGAVENLGCGSQSKPILRDLEQDPRVASARINHPGTLLAVAWREASQAPAGVPYIVSVFEKNDLEAATLNGPEREKAVRKYKSGQWYRAADVDRLSEREAEVIASRLVQRARLGLDPAVQTALTRDLTAVLARHLTSDPPADRAAIEHELVKVAGRHLTPSQMAELRKAGEQGVKALPGETR